MQQIDPLIPRPVLRNPRDDSATRARLPTPSTAPRVSALHALALLLAFSLTACTMHTQSFDAETWKSQRGVATSDNRRGSLVADIDKALRIGMSRSDVIALLGEPDSSRPDASADVYEIGRSPYGIDDEFYEIRYVDGKVQSHDMGRR